MKKIIKNIIIQAVITFLLSLIMFWILIKLSILPDISIFILAISASIGGTIPFSIIEYMEYKFKNKNEK